MFNLVVEGKAVDAPVESGGDVPGCTESTDWSSCSKIIRRKLGVVEENLYLMCLDQETSLYT